jgi:recombination protein RecA
MGTLKQQALNICLKDDASFNNFFIGNNEQLVNVLKNIHNDSNSFIYLWGLNGSGKTHLLSALCQLLGENKGSVAYLPLEDFKRFDPQVLNDLEQMDVVVIDSVAALVPRAEIEGDMGDVHMGLQARLMSQALRKLTAGISKSMTAVIFINQIRMKIGVMFGNPETTPGGRALKFYSSVRLDIRKIGNIKDGQDIVGNRTCVKVVKNKVAPPFKEAEFDIMYGDGISTAGDLLDMGVKMEVIEKSGTWYSFDDERIGQGRENARKIMKENPDVSARILEKLRDALGLAHKETNGSGAAPVHPEEAGTN